ncbi:DNA cytosine methyltransferase [Burkholderia cepacia]|nr:DNA cytosine methyltransferase [Burkholderia cepacia]
MTRRTPSSRPVLSLFTGAGGLDLGLEEAGFSTRICVEIDADARATLKANRPRWQLAEPADIHKIEPEELLDQAKLKPREAVLLAGGPPCQPFSKSAYWALSGARGLMDPRASTLGAYLKVVEAAQPQVLLLENVKGLTTNGKDEGLQLLREGLRKINRRVKTNYELQVMHVNAADYGVPQFRERVFILAAIDGRTLDLPSPTHGEGLGLTRFCTAWDAIGHLDFPEWPTELEPLGKWAALLSSIPEGQNYLWHTPRGGGEPLFGWRTRYWSFLLKLAKNQPSWTIQAAPGPATGPFHWRGRQLSTEELARLQTFPLGYRFEGGRRSVHRQIGNAVPSALGEFLGLEIRRQLLGERVRRRLRLIPTNRHDCRAPEPTTSVPRQYLSLRAEHQDHPGAGLGPAARLRMAELETE